LVSAASLAAPAGFFAAVGGLDAFPLWTILLPLEAILLCSRRSALLAGAIGCTSFAAGWILTVALAVRPDLLDSAALTLIAGLVVAGYFGLVAIAARTIFDAELAREVMRAARYRMIAENTNELVTRHGRSGAVTFASAAAETLLGVPVSALTGHG